MVPALAVAGALRDRGADVEWVGGERAERELVPAAGYPFHALTVSGLDRRNPLRAARAAGLASLGVAHAARLLRRLRPDAVLGGGGYVAGPVGLAAAALRIPLALSEADSHLGLTNRLLAPLAARVFLAFPVEGRTDAARYVVTGRPIPAGTGEADRGAARRRFGIPEQAHCLLVFGGSLGARSLNHAAIDAFGSAAPCVVLHVAGTRDFAELELRLIAMGRPAHYRLESYVTPFADAYAAADLVAARSGGSVFELAAAGLPSVLVPYPHATADHQTGNARWLADGGAAVVVADAELDGPRLAREVGALLRAPEHLRAMSRAALTLARPQAAEQIAEALMAMAIAGSGHESGTNTLDGD